MMSEPPTDPFQRFTAWFDEAASREINDANAMTLATATPDGRPSARMVLLKEHDARGFVFYTNTESRKGGELAANRHVALLFHWKSLRRQIRIEGIVEMVTDAEADAYFATRPRVSRLGAWASAQSRPLASRTALMAKVAEYGLRFLGDHVPRPRHWTGYRVLPAYFEFWDDGAFRLHDRITYTRILDGGWAIDRLNP
jgi:pyridoxamine 5'-phosphate oxidase